MAKAESFRPDPERVEFFLVTLPGLEDLVEAEVRDWYPELETRTDHGGVTVFAPLETGLAMNLALKIPTRILVRVAHFRCRDFPKLYNMIAKIPWKEWIDPSCELVAHASTRLSRLKIKSRIEDACLDGWMEYAQSQGVRIQHGKTANLYVRLLNDECTLSLDTSGERLHKRGERQHVGEAPLRETIAAALIQMAGRSDAEAGTVEVVDPMMGSGTFLLESASRDQLVEKREFAFERFPRTPSASPELHAKRPAVKKLTGFEADGKTLQAAKTNLKVVQTGHTLDLHGEDFFKAQPLPPAEDRRWLFANPPYGERLKVDEPLVELYERLFQAAEKVAKPDRACFLLPSKAVKGKFKLPPGWKVLEKRPFVNGGIPVTAFLFGRI